MLLKFIVLFFVPLFSGLLIFAVPGIKKNAFKLLLVFAGSYLFGITVIHILPELYRAPVGTAFVGAFVLAGFFLQQILEYFTAGVEHGHIHKHNHDSHMHQHTGISALTLLLALCVHAFLEGAMLAQPTQMGPRYDTHAILLGIALHRAPAAFALMTVLAFQLGSKKRAIPHLVSFSMAAPLGLLISNYLTHQNILSDNGLIYLYALVSGNFLHISTTIVFESSPDHRFNARKLTIAIVGSLLAVLIEYLV